jgi:MFS family permease
VYQAGPAGALLRKRLKLPASRFGWMNVAPTVLLLGITSLLADISAEMINTTLPLYMLVTLRLSPFQVGLTDGIYQGAAVVVSLLSGVLSDRWRRPKQIAATGYALSAVSRLGLLTAVRWPAISAVLMADRIGKGIRTAPRDAMIAASSRAEEMATSFGVHRALDTAGSMIGPLLAVLILSLAPERYDAIFIVSLCVGVISVAVIGALVQDPTRVETPSGTAQSSEPAITRAMVVGLLRQRDFRVLLIVGSGLALVTIGDSLLYLALQRGVKMQPGMFPMLYVVTAFGFMVFAIPAGRIADRVGHRTMFLAGYVLLAVVYGVLLLPHPTYVVAFVALMMLGCYYAATDGVLMAMASRLLPANLRATGLAMLSTATGLARLAASALYGLAWSRYGATRALLVFGVGLVVAIGAGRWTVFRHSTE